MVKQITLPVSSLRLNNGQVEGLPKNPRFIKDDRFESLKKSIEDAPEMLELREVIAYDNNGEYVIIAGNMRFRALKELGIKEVPCKILPTDTPVEKLREYTIKDNIAYGSNDWDIIANDWNLEELNDWGMEVDFLMTDEPADKLNTDLEQNPFNPDNLPEELRDMDLSREKIDNIKGDDETAMERVIIVFPKDEKDKMANLLGIEEVTKVVYHLKELTDGNE